MKNKKNPPLKKRNLIVFFLVFVFSIFLLKVSLCEAEVEEPEINYSDKDYITAKVEPKEGEYKINIESKEGGSVDWIGYVSQLNSEIFTSPSHFYESAKNNGTFYLDEGKLLGLVYAKAKSFFRYLDVISSAIDFGVNKVFGNPFSNTLTVPLKEESIYLIRTYSGSWGKFADPDEKPFVREKIYKGNERDRQACLLNVSLATFDTLGIFIPFGDFASDELNVIIEAGLRKADGITTAKAMGIEGSKEVTKYLFRIAVETGEASLLKAGEIIKKDVAQNFFKFISRSCKIAVKVVDIGSKISNVGQVADRVIQMVTVATPLETSYIIVGNPLLTLEEKESGLLEKAGPAALVPPKTAEEKLKEEKKEESTEPKKEGLKITAFVKNQHGEAVPEANFWLTDEKGKEYTRRSTSQTGYLEIDITSLSKGEYTLHIEKVSWSGLTKIPYCDPYEKKITIGEQDISLGTITVHKWSKVTAKIVDESGSSIRGTGPCSGFELIDKAGHSPNYYPNYPSHWGGFNQYGFLETLPLPDGEYTLKVWVKWDCPLGESTIAERKINIAGNDVDLGEIVIPIQ